MKKILISLFIIAIIIALYALFFMSNEKVEDKNMEKVKIAVYNGEASFLIILAKQLNYFEKYNLDVELIYNKSGKVAMDTMLNGEAQYSTHTEFVSVKNSFKNDSFNILASISEANVNGMLGFKSSGIFKPEDIKGKTIGTSIGTATEFYTGVFLNQHGLTLNDVKILNVPVKQRYEVMEKKSVDALFAWEPYIYNLQEKYKNELVYYSMPVGFNYYFLLSVDKNYHQSHKNVSKAILNAIFDAEKFKNKNESTFFEMLNKQFNLTNNYGEYIKDKQIFELTLPFTLNSVMNNQAKWLVENNLVEKKNIDINSFIDLEPLKEINSSSVTYIK